MNNQRIRRHLSDSEAAAWVIRRRAGLDPQDEREFDAWLRTADNRDAFDRLSAMQDALDRVRRQGSTTSIVTLLEVRARRRRARRRTVTAAFGALVMAAGALWLGPRLGHDAGRTALESGAWDPIRRLPDGSIVELKPGAEISVRFEPAARRVTLVSGEALFRVEKKPDRPFVVQARGIEVCAVGTAFNVRLEPAMVEVLVTEGRVRVEDSVRRESLLADPPGQESADAEAAPLLAAGQKVVIHTAAGQHPESGVRISLTAAQMNQHLAWRIPRLEFDGTDLAAAIAQMNRQNRLQIRLGDDSLRGLRVSGNFSPEDPESFARLVAATFGLAIEHQPNGDLCLVRP